MSEGDDKTREEITMEAVQACDDMLTSLGELATRFAVLEKNEIQKAEVLAEKVGELANTITDRVAIEMGIFQDDDLEDAKERVRKRVLADLAQDPQGEALLKAFDQNDGPVH